MSNKGTISSTKLAELIVVILLLGVIFWMRAVHLDADPPLGLSTSTDVYTDPPQYTFFAKMFIQTGDFNPFHDNRFVFFLKSSVTVLALVVFKLFGVSLWSSHFVGLLFSFGSLFLFFLLVYKVSSPLAGIFFLLLIATDYNQIFYSRLPFLEHSMTFFGFLSIVLLLYKPSRIVAFIAGISLAIGIFFGKVIGLIFLFPFACFFIYNFLYKDKKSSLNNSIFFSVGFLVITVFWLFFSYIPMKHQVTAYLGEQAFSLYGTPEGLKSFDNFVWKLVSFGIEANLFQRMKLPAMLGEVFLGIFFYRSLKKKSWKEGFGSFNAGHIFIATAIIAFYLALMIWNYRPLRYQLAIIYPFYGAAATVLWMLWKKWQHSEYEKVPYVYLFFCFLLVLVPFYQFYNYYIEHTRGDFYYDDYKYVVAGYSLILSVIVFLIVTYLKKGIIPKIQLLGKIIVVVLVGLILYKGYLDYSFYYPRATFTTRDNSRDLGMILPADAVLSGPYAPVMTLGNNLKAIIHMFGVSKVDSNLFKRFPITHLLLDENNETRAQEDYPRIMDSSVLIITYHIGLKRIRLYRIAGYTGNPQANNYQLSLFEKIADKFKKGDSTINQLAIEFLKKYPDNISCYLLLAEAAEKDSVLKLSEMMFKKTVEFSPTNCILNARLGKFYSDRYKELKRDNLKKLALNYYAFALKYAPTMTKVRQRYNELKGAKLEPRKKE